MTRQERGRPDCTTARQEFLAQLFKSTRVSVGGPLTRQQLKEVMARHGQLWRALSAEEQGGYATLAEGRALTSQQDTFGRSAGLEGAGRVGQGAPAAGISG